MEYTTTAGDSRLGYKKGDKATADRYFRESKNPNISDEEFIKSIEKF